MAEFPITDMTFTDKAFNEELMSSAVEDSVPPPPAELQGIVWVESMNTLAGFVGRRLYMSKNNEYHHWPHHFDLDDTITAIAENNGLLYVMTRGRPYVVSLQRDCKAAACLDIIRLPGNYPMVGSGNKHVAELSAGVIYPSHEGLILLSGNSAETVFTWANYSEYDWQAMEPHTMVASEFGGKIFVFMAQGAFIIRSPSNNAQGWENDTHTELSDRDVLDVFQLTTGELCLLKPDGVYLWNRGEELRPHRWISRTFSFATPHSMGAVHAVISNGPEHIKIVSDDRTVLDRDIPSKRVMRLPMWAHGRQWYFELTGTAEVSIISIAPSMHDLGQ